MSSKLSIIIGGVIAVIVGFTCIQIYADIDFSNIEFNFRLLTLGFAATVTYRVFNTFGWIFVVRALHSPMKLIAGAKIWLTSETLKWLPGSVWGYCSRGYQAYKQGVGKVDASLSVTLELVLTLIAWSLTVVIGAWCSEMNVDSFLIISPYTVIAVVLVIIVGSICMRKFVFDFCDSKISRKWVALRKDISQLNRKRPCVRLLCSTVIFYTGLCILNGIAFWLVLSSLSDELLDISTIVAINAVGWLCGFLAIGVPGGIGVREVSMTSLLAFTMPLEVAIAGTCIWRLIQIGSELFCLLPFSGELPRMPSKLAKSY